MSELDPSGRERVEALIRLVRTEGAEILATLEGLEEEIRELQVKGDKLKKGDLTVEDLETKLKKHLRNWKKRQSEDES